MRADRFSDRARALDEVPIGHALRVRQILFDGLREECTRIGIREGEVFRLEMQTDTHLLLDSGQGRRVVLKREFARFIEVAIDPGWLATPPVSRSAAA